jgi:putative ABC transport system permease protein
MLPELVWRSLANRRSSVLLTVLALSVGVVLVIGVEHLRAQARESFGRTVSGTDLIVGARTSQLNLLLYSVFRIGTAGTAVGWDSYELVSADPRVAWSIPLALGDSYRGYPVVGTTAAYFEHYRYGSQQALVLRAGRVFGADRDAVLGADVARTLGVGVGAELVLAHGLVSTAFSLHRDAPFTVVGVLTPTGTPVDRSVHVSLQALERMHAREDGHHDHADTEPERPGSLSAFLLGLHDRAAAFGLQRDINEYRGEALSAILPGVALAELWQGLGAVERLLGALSGLVMLATLLGLSALLLVSMRERGREIALYRALGAHASTILLLVLLEALLVTVFSIGLGVLAACLLLRAGRSWLSENWGLSIDLWPLNPSLVGFMLLILTAALLLSFIPAFAAYRHALARRLRFGV